MRFQFIYLFLGATEWTRQGRLLILQSWHSPARVGKLQAAGQICSLCPCQLPRHARTEWPWKPHVNMASLCLGPWLTERRHPPWRQSKILLCCLHFSSVDIHSVWVPDGRWYHDTLRGIDAGDGGSSKQQFLGGHSDEHVWDTGTVGSSGESFWLEKIDPELSLSWR